MIILAVAHAFVLTIIPNINSCHPSCVDPVAWIIRIIILKLPCISFSTTRCCSSQCRFCQRSSTFLSDPCMNSPVWHLFITLLLAQHLPVRLDKHRHLNVCDLRMPQLPYRKLSHHLNWVCYSPQRHHHPNICSLQFQYFIEPSITTITYSTICHTLPSFHFPVLRSSYFASWLPLIVHVPTPSCYRSIASLLRCNLNARLFRLTHTHTPFLFYSVRFDCEPVRLLKLISSCLGTVTGSISSLFLDCTSDRIPLFAVIVFVYDFDVFYYT